ncbi:hypothetical protein [Pendulispora albinea]|uniref:Uncharacterized protein n=1 Tax=Pendulispora albinea TaxID=2741071 RepID=A0ABZ2M6S3_9BACT
MRTASVSTVFCLGLVLLLVGGCPPAFDDLCSGAACGVGGDVRGDTPAGDGGNDAGFDVGADVGTLTDASPTDAAQTDGSSAGDSGVNPGIRCDNGNGPPPGVSCSPRAQVCCITTPFLGPRTYRCAATTECPGSSTDVRVACDEDRDCSGAQRCCGTLDGDRFTRITCDALNRCPTGQFHLCQSDADCGPGSACTGLDTVHKIYRYCKP